MAVFPSLPPGHPDILKFFAEVAVNELLDGDALYHDLLLHPQALAFLARGVGEAKRSEETKAVPAVNNAGLRPLSHAGRL